MDILFPYQNSNINQTCVYNFTVSTGLKAYMKIAENEYVSYNGVNISAGFEIIETGTLEKDVKYAAKFPVIVLFICKAVNWVSHSRHFERFYEILFNRFCLLIYNLCRITGLRKVFLKIVKEKFS